MNRLTTLDHMILRNNEKRDTYIYTVPKVNKVKAYCKLGKLEDIMEYFKINSIDQLVNILEAWEVVKPSIHHIKEQQCFVIHNMFQKNQYNAIKKGLKI